MDGKEKIRVQKEKKPARKAKETVDKRNVEFTFYAPMAREVYLAGEFNHWDTQTLPMKKRRGGAFGKQRSHYHPGAMNISCLSMAVGSMKFLMPRLSPIVLAPITVSSALNRCQSCSAKDGLVLRNVLKLLSFE